VLEAAATGLDPGKPYVLALSDKPSGAGTLESLQGFMTNPAGSAHRQCDRTNPSGGARRRQGATAAISSSRPAPPTRIAPSFRSRWNENAASVCSWPDPDEPIAAEDEPSAVVDLAHLVKFFARNLGGLTRARTCAGPARLYTPSMHADEKLDEVVVPTKRPNKEGNFRRRSWREGPHPRETADRRPWLGH